MQIYKLPDLNKNAKMFTNYIINNVQYTFNFEWCDDFAICTAYFIANNENVYLFKGKPLTINTDLLNRIKNPEIINGQLILKNIYEQPVEPIQENFGSDYQLVYIPQEELTNV